MENSHRKIRLCQKSLYILTLCNILMLISLNSFSINQEQTNTNKLNHFPVEDAFILSFEKDSTNKTIIAHWKIANDYHLYKDQIKILALPSSELKIGEINLPRGIPTQNIVRGNYEIYKESVRIPIQVIGDGILKLEVNYQGCKGTTSCYPPITKQFTLNIDQLPISNTTSLNSQTTVNQYTNTLANYSLWSRILAFFGIGFLLAFTPCILPMLPILSAIILDQKRKPTALQTFMLILTYVLSMSFTYAIAGILAGYIGNTIQSKLQNPIVLSLFGLFFVLLAFSLFGLYELQLPSFITNRINFISSKQRSGTYIGVAIMGCLSTLIVSPCVSAPLVGVLAYISSTGNIFLGGVALFLIGLGMGAPLLIMGTIGGKYLPKVGNWINFVKIIFGILMLGMAIWILSRIISAKFTMILSGLLSMGIGIFLYSPFLLNLLKNWHIFQKFLAILVFLYGSSLVVGACTGNYSYLSPLSQQTSYYSDSSFRKVYSIIQLNNELELAKKQKKPVILDYYAEWCISCKEMDKTIFSNTEAEKAISNFILLKADVTKNNEDSQLLQKKYHVLAPPSIIFFNADGECIENIKIDGLVDLKTFLQLITKISN